VQKAEAGKMLGGLDTGPLATVNLAEAGDAGSLEAAKAAEE
jgi:hypothetical protein